MTDGDYRPGLEGVIALETAISLLDPEQEAIVIRGYDLIELARSCSYLEVARLILDGELPGPEELHHFAGELRQAAAVPPAIWRIMGELPAGTHPMNTLRTALSALAPFDPDLDQAGPEAERRMAIRLLARIPQLVANGWRIRQGHEPVAPDPDQAYSAAFLSLITGDPHPPEPAVRAFDRLLIAYAEHEMPNSTFTARVIASTRADIYGAFTGAAASLKGTLHGGANEAVMYMLEAVGEPGRFEAYLLDKLARKERVMGFGHRVYRNRPDPRALLMKETLKELAGPLGRMDLVALCEEGERVMAREKGLYPNLDYYAAPVYHLLGVPTPLFTPLFFAARSVGLAAHVLEQHAANRLFRPRVRYTGPRGKHPPSRSGRDDRA
ncbi:bifunctional citrate synthase/2-methylcitrate synthase [Candidatus Hydrogenisulfobacillus filiaventi]|uniref:Citrate synthase n=1 Tax=Candidatus Hydrogenisulfobacillus filiaventi TaxID=2707344 RepID=A0A6F8ZCX7_9FIRM|nr:bifunctional citrate synthase/2-methylcitrate synthase [Candidatus Hydrogenisulfobacillus filiaventi]